MCECLLRVGVRDATYIQSPARKEVFGFGGLLEIVYGGLLYIFGPGGALWNGERGPPVE